MQDLINLGSHVNNYNQGTLETIKDGVLLVDIDKLSNSEKSKLTDWIRNPQLEKFMGEFNMRYHPNSCVWAQMIRNQKQVAITQQLVSTFPIVINLVSETDVLKAEPLMVEHILENELDPPSVDNSLFHVSI